MRVQPLRKTTSHLRSSPSYLIQPRLTPTRHHCCSSHSHLQLDPIDVLCLHPLTPFSSLQFITADAVQLYTPLGNTQLLPNSLEPAKPQPTASPSSRQNTTPGYSFTLSFQPISTYRYTHTTIFLHQFTQSQHHNPCSSSQRQSPASFRSFQWLQKLVSDLSSSSVLALLLHTSHKSANNTEAQAHTDHPIQSPIKHHRYTIHQYLHLSVPAPPCNSGSSPIANQIIQLLLNSD